ncbi:MAG: tetratricopeptide repeat protein, partial [Candidatus Ratteibacteria bacterium]|nr:tetratricopeptide repeat protein [Candidatus Ratteibacteria bacterium]
YFKAHPELKPGDEFKLSTDRIVEIADDPLTDPEKTEMIEYYKAHKDELQDGDTFTLSTGRVVDIDELSAAEETEMVTYFKAHPELKPGDEFKLSTDRIVEIADDPLTDPEKTEMIEYYKTHPELKPGDSFTLSTGRVVHVAEEEQKSIIPHFEINIPYFHKKSITKTSETLTGKAWQALMAGNPAQVEINAAKCICGYVREARAMQDRLKNFAPPGREFDYWALNDVGTSYFVLAEAYNQSGNYESAKACYQTVIDRYPHSQCYDPSYDSFWKPAEAAGERIEEIEQREAGGEIEIDDEKVEQDYNAFLEREERAILESEQLESQENKRPWWYKFHTGQKRPLQKPEKPAVRAANVFVLFSMNPDNPDEPWQVIEALETEENSIAFSAPEDGTYVIALYAKGGTSSEADDIVTQVNLKQGDELEVFLDEEGNIKELWLVVPDGENLAELNLNYLETDSQLTDKSVIYALFDENWNMVARIRKDPGDTSTLKFDNMRPGTYRMQAYVIGVGAVGDSNWFTVYVDEPITGQAQEIATPEIEFGTIEIVIPRTANVFTIFAMDPDDPEEPWVEIEVISSHENSIAFTAPEDGTYVIALYAKGGTGSEANDAVTHVNLKQGDELEVFLDEEGNIKELWLVVPDGENLAELNLNYLDPANSQLTDKSVIYVLFDGEWNMVARIRKDPGDTSAVEFKNVTPGHHYRLQAYVVGVPGAVGDSGLFLAAEEMITGQVNEIETKDENGNPIIKFGTIELLLPPAEPDMDSLPAYPGTELGERVSGDGGDWVWIQTPENQWAEPDMDSLPESPGTELGERLPGDNGNWVWIEIPKSEWSPPDESSLPDYPGAELGERVPGNGGDWFWANTYWIWAPYKYNWGWQPYTQKWQWWPYI